jgi:uncharacterized protein
MLLLRLSALVFCSLWVVACQKSNSIDPSSASKPVQSSPAPQQHSSNYTTIEWTDLMPKDDLEALLNPPEYLQNIEDGSDADQLNSRIKSKPVSEKNDRYQQALASKTVMPEFDQRAIRIPGFIVPLEFDEDQTITAFFLVPFFGACIHEPPPPPNQIIYAKYTPGIKLDVLYDPFWVKGILATSITENETATAAYSMTVNSIEPYSEEEGASPQEN